MIKVTMVTGQVCSILYNLQSHLQKCYAFWNFQYGPEYSCSHQHELNESGQTCLSLESLTSANIQCTSPSITLNKRSIEVLIIEVFVDILMLPTPHLTPLHTPEFEHKQTWMRSRKMGKKVYITGKRFETLSLWQRKCLFYWKFAKLS